MSDYELGLENGTGSIWEEVEQEMLSDRDYVLGLDEQQDSTYYVVHHGGALVLDKDDVQHTIEEVRGYAEALRAVDMTEMDSKGASIAEGPYTAIELVKEHTDTLVEAKPEVRADRIREEKDDPYKSAEKGAELAVKDIGAYTRLLESAIEEQSSSIAGMPGLHKGDGSERRYLMEPAQFGQKNAVAGWSMRLVEPGDFEYDRALAAKDIARNPNVFEVAERSLWRGNSAPIDMGGVEELNNGGRSVDEKAAIHGMEHVIKSARPYVQFLEEALEIDGEMKERGKEGIQIDPGMRFRKEHKQEITPPKQEQKLELS